MTLLTRARGLAPLIEREADRSEADATLAPAVVEAFHESGLFGLMVPKELGGEEADLPTVLEVYEEVCRADGSAGWTLLANATTSAFAGAYTGAAAIDAMFGGEQIPVAAGQFSPRGTAIREDHGFTVAGSYSFGSGSAHAGWIGGGAVELRDGELVMSDAGTPVIRAFFVPRERVTFLGNWDVMGLAGTGSYDYEVPEQTVDEAFTFDLVNAEARRGGPVYRLGVLGLTAAGHAAFALGVGKRAMEELTRIVQTKHRLGADPLRDQQLFRHDYAMHDAAVHAARAFVFESFAAAQDALERGRRSHPRTTTTPAPGHHLRHACRHRRGALRLHRRRQRRPPAQRAAALLPRHPRGHATPRGRQQHAHRDDAGAARPGALRPGSAESGQTLAELVDVHDGHGLDGRPELEPHRLGEARERRPVGRVDHQRETAATVGGVEVRGLRLQLRQDPLNGRPDRAVDDHLVGLLGVHRDVHHDAHASSPLGWRRGTWAPRGATGFFSDGYHRSMRRR